MWIDMRDDCVNTDYNLGWVKSFDMVHVSKWLNDFSLVNKYNGRSLCQLSGSIILDFHTICIKYFVWLNYNMLENIKSNILFM